MNGKPQTRFYGSLKESRARELEVLNCSEVIADLSEIRPGGTALHKSYILEKPPLSMNSNSSRYSHNVFNRQNTPFYQEPLSSYRVLAHSESVPEEVSENVPAPSRLLSTSTDKSQNLFFASWNKGKDVIRNQTFSTGVGHTDGTTNGNTFSSLESFNQTLFSIPQHQVKAEEYCFFKYISQRSYLKDSNWMSRDSYFQIMLNSLRNGQEGMLCFKKAKPKSRISSPVLDKGFFGLLSHWNTKRVVLLDLDETLIRAEPCGEEWTGHPIINVAVDDFEEEEKYEIIRRPYLDHFLEKMSEIFTLVLYTAGTSDYAIKAMDIVDPSRKYIKKILSREQCIDLHSLFLKDLRLGAVDGVDLENVLLVDNYIHSFAMNLEQGIPIKPFYGDSQDRELLHLLDLLSHAVNFPSFQLFLKTHCGFLDFFNFLISQEPYFSVD